MPMNVKCEECKQYIHVDEETEKFREAGYLHVICPICGASNEL
jgi:Zn finger protein HypA/HybF involved in hydrogenase expression